MNFLTKSYGIFIEDKRGKARSSSFQCFRIYRKTTQAIRYLYRKKWSQALRGRKTETGKMRSLLRKPQFLIFDEPTNHLDKDFIDAFFNFVKKLKPCLRILCVTHDLSLIERVNHIIDISQTIRSEKCIFKGFKTT